MCELGPRKDDMALKNMYINPAGEIDEKTLAHIFLATSKGWFLVVFVSGVAHLYILRNKSCSMQGLRL